MTGRAIFTPASQVVVPSVPETRAPAPVEGTYDTNGFLQQADHLGVHLFPSDGGNPTNVTWRVEFRNLRTRGGELVQLPPFSFLVNAGESRDLSLLMPVASSPGLPLPDVGSVTPSYVAGVIHNHETDDNPHDAYDNAESFSALYENGLI